MRRHRGFERIPSRAMPAGPALAICLFVAALIAPACVPSHGDIFPNFTVTDVWFGNGERWAGVSGYSNYEPSTRKRGPRVMSTSVGVEISSGRVVVEQEVSSKREGLEPSGLDETSSYFHGELSSFQSFRVQSDDGSAVVELTRIWDEYEELGVWPNSVLMKVYRDGELLSVVALNIEVEDLSEQP